MDEYKYANGNLIHTPIIMRPVAQDHWIYRFREYREKAQVMELAEDVTVHFVFKRQTWTLDIKAGFVFDGASIPQIFWSSIGSPWDSKILVAALVHDALYSAQPRSECGTYWTIRQDADSILRVLCGYLGMGWLKRLAVYVAVDTCGADAYMKVVPYDPITASKFVKLRLA